jgi:hypothetical protein
MPMNAEFQMDFIAHDEYEYLAVELSFRGQHLCQLYRRKSGDVIDIEFIEDRLILEPPVRLKFPLIDFLEAIQEARQELVALKL